MGHLEANKFIDLHRHLKDQEKMSSTEASTTSMSSIFDSIGTNGTVSTVVTPSNSFERPPVNFEFDLNLSKSIIILSGLPATGKSTISKLLTNYLNKSSEYKTKIFNCGSLRRQKLQQFNNFEFFDPCNVNTYKQREQFAIENLNEMIDELNTHKINIGVLDATNTTIDRRQKLIKLIKDQIELDNLIFLDIRCDQPRLINYNIHAKTNNEDYKNSDYDLAIQDFKMRLKNYYKAYEPISHDETTEYALTGYFMINNGGQQYESELNKYDRLLQIIDSFFMEYQRESTPGYLKKVDDFYDAGEMFLSV